MKFKDKLLSGKFIITAEVSPPKGADIKEMLKNAGLVKDITDAINVTDNQRAVMRMSAQAACGILEREGYETIMHLTCRDRNRLALQSELLGACALGIRNVLVMSGDHPVKGDHPGAKPVYDLDSVQLLGLIRELNKGFDFSGNLLSGRTDFCTGAVTNTDINELSLIKISKKIKMGAGFIQTQAVFDTGRFGEFMDRIESKLQGGRVKIIAGIIPLKSEKNAKFMDSNIAGIKIPDELIKRMQTAKNPEKCGMKIAAGLINELRDMCGGVHIMPIGNHENTREILEIAGII